MVHDLIVSLAASLFLTLVLEGFFAFITGVRKRMDYLLLLLVNILTNPAVVLCYFLSRLIIPFTGLWLQLILELCAIIAEGSYYKKYAVSIKRPFLFSVSANGFSYGIGLLIHFLMYGGII